MKVKQCDFEQKIMKLLEDLGQELDKMNTDKDRSELIKKLEKDC